MIPESIMSSIIVYRLNDIGVLKILFETASDVWISKTLT